MTYKRKLFVLLFTLLICPMASAVNPLIPAPPSISASSYLLIDAHSGEVLVENNPDQKLPPASLTKMMTSYIATHELDKGNVNLADKVRVSIKAWKTPGSRMYIREGTYVTLEDLLRGIIIQSGNDASVAVAEYLAGSEDAFAGLMNQHAKRLGMTGTNFVNATGLPDENHYMTASDLAKMARSIIVDHPTYYPIYSEKAFTYNNIRQPNRNKLLSRDASVDGLKTGHTEEAGYCLVASAVRDGMRLIAVVMSTDSEEARATETQKLLTYGFRFYETHKLYSARQSLNEAKVWGGKADVFDLGVSEDLYITIPRGQHAALSASLDIDKQIMAPIQQGSSFGNVTIQLHDQVIVQKPLVALQSVDQAGFFKRFWDRIVLFFLSLIS